MPHPETGISDSSVLYSRSAFVLQPACIDAGKDEDGTSLIREQGETRHGSLNCSDIAYDNQILPA
jgi:hypothetical protein